MVEQTYNPQLTDPEAVETAYHTVQELSARHDSVYLEQAVDVLEELPYEHPEIGTSNGVQIARSSITDALYRFDGDQPLTKEDQVSLKDVRDTLSAEYGDFPAMGTRRHHNLNARQKNL